MLFVEHFYRAIIFNLLNKITNFNLGFVSDRIALAEPNQLIDRLETLLAAVGFAANLFILRYVLK